MSSDVSGPVGGDVARIESLERRVSALALGFESLLYILAGDADDDIKRAAFCEALALAKTPALIADAEQALAEGAREGRARELRRLLAKARSTAS
jgi:hypothetical protein